MAEKHIFIGLGGAGVNTLAQIKYKIYEKLPSAGRKSRVEQLQEKYRFLFIDTDSEDIRKNNAAYRDRFELGKTDFINPVEELIDLGEQNPLVIYRDASKSENTRINKRITEACHKEVANDIPNSDLRLGAGAFRIKSRIAFARKADDFINKMHIYINGLNSISEGAVEKNTIYYWIISSSNGGTGSGIVNDVLYFVNMVHKQLVGKSDPQLALLLYMPQYYIDVNNGNERYPKNAYAVLSELKAFQVLSREIRPHTPFHRLALLRDYTQFDTQEVYRPFSYCIPVDYQTDKGTNMGSLQNMYHNTAEMIYYIHSGPGASGFRSILDNYINEIQSRSADAFLIPMGYIALRKPEKDFEDYVQIRLRYELLKYGIIGLPKHQGAQTAKEVYKDYINKKLFDKSGGSLYATLKQQVNDMLEERMPDGMIRDSDNKVMKKLPLNVNQTETDQLVKEIEYTIYKKEHYIKEVLAGITSDLWGWIEEHSLRYGLEYVQSTLFELDIYCTNIYDSYTGSQQGRVSEHEAKQEQINSLAATLDDLYKNALEITVSERVTGSNKKDVEAYFSALKDYATRKVDLIMLDQVNELLKMLCVGTNGVVDKMRRHVANLLSEAKHILSGERGPEFAYGELAKSFMEKTRDVTSVYLPKIQDFAETYGWKEGHKFSKWYEEIITPSDTYDKGKGYIPVRYTGEHSLEAFLRSLADVNKELMITKGYYAGEEMKLFRNPEMDNYRTVIEDILSFAARSMEDKYRKNQKINSEWFAKTLPQFFDELDKENRDDIRKRMNPSLFFTYEQEKDNNLLATRTIYVAGSDKIAREVLQYNPGDKTAKFATAEESSMIYIIKARMGLSFDFYRRYDIIEREYMNTVNKREFHFHTAFADCNGAYDQIVLPEEFEPELITLAHYILMDGYKDILSRYYYVSGNDFDKDHYTNTPFVFEDKRVVLAKRSNLSSKGEYICLTRSNGVNELYLSLVFGASRTPCCVVYEKLKEMYIREGLEQSIANLIKDMLWVAKVKMEMNYDDVRQHVINEYTRRLHATDSREESSLLNKLLMVFTTKLDSFEKFIM
ncbi:MAG: tubulin-like doman-containing protein [Tannerellaceae bacterium]|jgi:hypothetical protein|nr:tubulin-like doman-containing protein [Tannerellaceae bacterium]